MDINEIRSFMEENRPLIDDLENLTLKFSIAPGSVELQHEIKNLFEKISIEAGRHNLQRLDAVCEIFSQVFNQLSNKRFTPSQESIDIINSGMEIIYRTLIDEENLESLEVALNEIEDSLILILSGEPLEIPPALMDNEDETEIEKAPLSVGEETISFIVEAREQLSNLDWQLGNLLENPSEFAMEDVYMSFYNINTNAQFLKLSKISLLASAAKGLINQIREKIIETTPAIIDTLHEARRSLLKLLSDLEGFSSERTEISSLVKKLEKLSTPEPLPEMVESYEPPEEKESLPSGEEEKKLFEKDIEEQSLKIEFLDEFLIEATDRISRIESELLKLEEYPETETINDILNSFHLMKGAALFIGLNKISRLSDKAEKILDKIKKQILSVEPNVIEALIKTVDTIRKIITEVEEEEIEKHDITKTLELLDNIMEMMPAAASKPKSIEIPYKSEFSDEVGEKPDNMELFQAEFKDIFPSIIESIDLLIINPGDSWIEEKVLKHIRTIKNAASYVPSPPIIILCENLEKLLNYIFKEEIEIKERIADTINNIFKEIHLICLSPLTEKLTENQQILITAIKNIIEAISVDLHPGHELPDEAESVSIPVFTVEEDTQKTFDDRILSIKGFGINLLKNIKKAGFDSEEKLSNTTLDSLLEIKGINLNKAQKLMEVFNIHEKLVPPTADLDVPRPSFDLPTFTELKTEPMKPDQKKEITPVAPKPSPKIKPIIDREYSVELVSSFSNTAKEFLSDATDILSDISRIGNLDHLRADKLQTILKNLYSASNLMKYTQICDVINMSLVDVQAFLDSDSDDTAGFIRKITDYINMISEIVPVPGMEGEEHKPEKEVITSSPEAETEEDQELIFIFIKEADKNITELKHIIKQIGSGNAEGQMMSNLNSNLNNLQLSASFLGFEKLFDIVDIAKNLANMIINDKGGLDPNRFHQLHDYLNDIIEEVNKIGETMSAKMPGLIKPIPAIEKIILKESIPIINEKEKIVSDKLLIEESKPISPLKAEKKMRTIPEIRIQPAIIDDQADVPTDHEEVPLNTLRVDIERIERLSNIASRFIINGSVFAQLSENFQRFYKYLAESGKLAQNELRILHDLTNSIEQSIEILGRDRKLLQNCTKGIRLVSIDTLFQRIPYIVKSFATKKNKKIKVEFCGEETELDKTAIEKIADPIIHIIRYSVDYGIEEENIRRLSGKPHEGTITCSSYYEGDMVIIEIEDDGGGIDLDKLKGRVLDLKLIDEKELYRLSDKDLHERIFLPGFSWADEASPATGLHAGMKFVKENIEQLGGNVILTSEKNKGTKVILRIPQKLTIIKALLVLIDNIMYAVPAAAIAESVKITTDDINTVADEEVISIREQVIPLLRLSKIFKYPSAEHSEMKEQSESRSAILSEIIKKHPGSSDLPDKASIAQGEQFIIILQIGNYEAALLVDSLIGEQDVVIQNLEDKLIRIRGISGAAILGDGSISLILDVTELFRLSFEKDMI